MQQKRPTPADRLADELLDVSRIFVGVSIASLADVDPDLTLTQFRALAVINDHAGCSSAEFAHELGIHPSTATRTCDRLVARDLVARLPSAHSRREIELVLTDRGAELVARVRAHRRACLADLVADLDAPASASLTTALQIFRNAADSNTVDR